MAMSENVLRIPAAELTTLRVTCPKCRAAVEFEVHALDQREVELDCPLCGAAFPDRDIVLQLGRSLKKCAANKRLLVEFVLPEKK
jgi:hypothetical protein